MGVTTRRSFAPAGALRDAPFEAQRPAVAEHVMEAFVADLAPDVERRRDPLGLRERRLAHGGVEVGRRVSELQVLARLSQRLRRLLDGRAGRRGRSPRGGDVLAAHGQRVAVALERDPQRQARRGFAGTQRRARGERLLAGREPGPEDGVAAQSRLRLGARRGLDVGNRPGHREAVVAELRQLQPLDDVQ